MRAVAVWCALWAMTSWADEQKNGKISAPADILTRIEKSPTAFEVREIGELDVSRGRLTEELWRPLGKYGDLPKIVRKKDGSISLQRWPAPNASAKKEMALGETAYQAKNFADASMHYRKAAQLEPSYYLAYAYLGDALLFGDEDLEGALAQYEKAIALNPDDYRLYFFRSTVHRKLQHGAQSIADLRHALMLKPHNEVLLNMVRNSRGASGLRAEPDVFVPRAFVRRADETKVDVFVDARPEWVAWAMCKALWLDDKAYRKERTGSDTSTWHSLEDYECIANLVSVYVSQRDSKEGPRDDRLERLEAIVKDGLLTPFVLYEFGARVNPMLTVQLPAAQQALITKYIERYVLTDLEPAP